MFTKLYSSMLMLVIAGNLMAQTPAQVVSNFENIALDSNSYWNGSDLSGGFESGKVFFGNQYNAAWGAWSGWAVSNVSDNATPGYMNQYSAITGVGYDTVASHGANYAVTYVAGQSVIKIVEPLQHTLKGFYVTNSTYAALSMEQGDAFSKKFGGVSGTDSDWFKLSIIGMRNGVETVSTDFYLADFRSENTSEDYIVKTWEWVNLESFDKVDSLLFSLSSSDNGAWGMNTPGYFCIDNFTLVADQAPVVANPIGSIEANTDTENMTIDLSTVFADADTKESLITYFVTENSGAEQVSSTADGKNLVLDFISKGQATIKVGINANGLMAFDTFTVTVTDPNSVNDHQENMVKVWPNPASTQLNIEANDNDAKSIAIYNTIGKIELLVPDFASERSIDISALPNGVYVVNILGNNRSQSLKFIKQ